MTSSSYKKIVKANIDYWLKQTADLAETDLHTLAQDFPNLLRAVQQGLMLPEARTADLAQLVRQSIRLIETQGLWEIWLPILDESLNQCVKEAPLLQVKLTIQKGNLLRLSGQLESATEVHHQAILLAQKTGDLFSVANANYYLSEDYRYSRQYDMAEKFGKVALELFRQLQPEAKLGIAGVYNTLGLTVWEQGEVENLKLAEDYLQQAVNYSKQINQPLTLARALMGLGLVLQKQSKYRLALENFEKAGQLIEQVGSDLDKSKLYNCLGILYFEWGRFQEAESAFKEANSQILQQLGDIFTQAALNQNLGLVILQQGRANESELHLRKSIDLWAQIENSLWYANALGTLAENLTTQGRISEGIRYYDLALGILQELDGSKVVKDLISQFSEQKKNIIEK